MVIKKKKKSSRPSLETVWRNLGGILGRRMDLKEWAPETVWKKENVKE